MLKLTKKQVLRIFLDYLIVTFAAVLNAISLYCFVDPSHLIAGGVSGLSSAIAYIICNFIDINFNLVKWIIYFVLNLPLLISSLIFLRGDFTFKTIWATVVCTAAGFLFTAYLPEEFQFTDSKIIAVVLGGLLIGIAMYLASEVNGSNGGTEIIAKIVAKRKPGTDLSTIILIANFTILIAGSIIVMIIEHERLGVVIYSLVYIYMGTFTMGVFKRGFNHPQKFMIITTKPDEMIQAITERFKRGLSSIDVENTREGSQDRKIIMVVVQYRQSSHLKRIIKQCDPNAFTIVNEIYDVFSRPLFNRSYKTK
ncbi:MAG: YitT family protein [Clostridia bacterium]|nr:YitT family protein [Clostridia bacterium]